MTINAGSSSIKFSLFDADTLREDYRGTISGIGFDVSSFTVVGTDDHVVLTREVQAHDHIHAVSLMRDWIADHIAAEKITALGYRLVHGGPSFGQPCLIDDVVLKELQSVVTLDPEHLPTQMAIIEQLRGAFTETPHIACFDTAFFHNLPVESRRLPLPRKYESQGIRRYGFHGLSYSYLLREFEQVAGHNAARGKVIFAHLGNGASLAALYNGQPLDTTMGLTPVGGIPMSTRSGDLDPGILTYLADREQLAPEQLRHIVGFESGLLGISETTSDMKKLLELEEHDPRAKEAVDIFCYNVRKQIGAYAAALGGLNSLVFSGGIGEVSSIVRNRICDGLEFLGIELDETRNQSGEECISTDDSQVGVHVLPTNEAMTIAREVDQIIKGDKYE